jgi:hypothetical protein
MRKLVLGIIAVGLAQFAFVNYLDLQSPIELAVAPVQKYPPAANPDLNLLESPTDSAVTMPDPPELVSRPRPRRTGTNLRAASVPEQAAKLDDPVVIHIPEPSAYRAPIQTAAPPEFQSVVIRYNGKPETSDCGAPDIPKPRKPSFIEPKKRSFIAKAVPVIKKPWDWIKALGSKLN